MLLPLWNMMELICSSEEKKAAEPTYGCMTSGCQVSIQHIYVVLLSLHATQSFIGWVVESIWPSCVWSETYVLHKCVFGKQFPFSPPISSSVLTEPTFVAAFWVKRKHDPDNEKIYIFFREKNSDNSPEADPWVTRVARVCKVSKVKHMARASTNLRVIRGKLVETLSRDINVYQ